MLTARIDTTQSLRNPRAGASRRAALSHLVTRIPNRLYLTRDLRNDRVSDFHHTVFIVYIRSGYSPYQIPVSLQRGTHRIHHVLLLRRAQESFQSGTDATGRGTRAEQLVEHAGSVASAHGGVEKRSHLALMVHQYVRNPHELPAYPHFL